MTPTAVVVGALVGVGVWAVRGPEAILVDLRVRGLGPAGRAAGRSGLVGLGCRPGLPRRRAGAERRDGAPAALARVGSLVRAGVVPALAWERALGVGTDAVGVPDAARLAEVLGGDEPEAQAATVVAACRVASDVGAGLVSVLDGIGQALAAETEARDDREATLAGPRATVVVLTWLPAVGVVLGGALGADPVRTLLDGGVGTASLLVGLGMLWCGRRWTARLVARARADGSPV